MNKNNFLQVVFLHLICFLLFSCANEDVLIDKYVEKISYIFSAEENKLEQLTSDNFVSEIKLEDVNIGKITRIKKFRGKYYLISPENQKIFVFDKETNQTVTVDYSPLNLIPSDICFPNATDGYVAHNNNSCVTILDLTNNKISNLQIATVGNSSSISGSGNQVHLVHSEENSVSIIDTRTNKVEKLIDFANEENPILVEFFDDGTKSVVISGENANKNHSNPEQIAAKISIIDAINGQIITSLPLGNNYESSQNLLPTSVTVSPKFIYISCENVNASSSISTVYRISTSNYQTKVAMSKSNSLFVGYDKVWNQIYLVENDLSPQLVIFDGNSNSKVKSLKLNKLPTAIISE